MITADPAVEASEDQSTEIAAENSGILRDSNMPLICSMTAVLAIIGFGLVHRQIRRLLEISQEFDLPLPGILLIDQYHIVPVLVHLVGISMILIAASKSIFPLLKIRTIIYAGGVLLVVINICTVGWVVWTANKDVTELVSS